MTSENASSTPKKVELKVNDRVKRISIDGCYGVVKDVREEASAKPRDNQEKALLINVNWDNGTISSFSPQALEVVKP